MSGIMELRRGGRASRKRLKKAQQQRDKVRGGSGSKGAYLAKTSGGKGKTTGRGTATSYGPAGSGSAGSGKSETERLQSQLAGAQALQRRTMAQYGAGDISKQQSKDAMRSANQRISEAARGLASMDPQNVIKGAQLSGGRPIMDSSGREKFDQIMRGVTGGKGSNFDNISRGYLRPGQNIGGINFPQGFAPYQGSDMRRGLEKFAPISQRFQDIMRRGVGPFSMLKPWLNKRADERIVDTKRTLSDMMTPEQNAKLDIIETENSENIFDPEASTEMASLDPEKIAMDTGLTPGNVYNPVAADKQSKVDFINQVENTNLTVDRVEQMAASNGMTLNDMFERSKQKQGMIIRDQVEIEEPEEDSVTGQFDLTDQGDINLTGDPDDVMSEFPKTTSYPVGDTTYGVRSGDFSPDIGISYDTVFSDKISDTPKVGEEIRGFDFLTTTPEMMDAYRNKERALMFQYPHMQDNMIQLWGGAPGLSLDEYEQEIYKADGGYADSAQYKMLKLINDTMNDG